MSVTVKGEPVVNVRVVKTPEELTELAVEFGAWSTITVPQIGSNTGTLAPILARRPSRLEARILIPQQGTPNPNPSPSQPAVPASGTAIQNTNPYPVTVVISGGAVTNVTVNGLTVGTGDGTYIVPSAGTISVTYTIAPTWVWSNANIQAAFSNPNLTSIVLAHRPDYVANPSNPQGLVIPIVMLPLQLTYKSQQPIYVVGVGSIGTIMVLDQAQAATSSQAEESITNIPEEYQEEGQGGSDPGYY